jgi:hypothetical protein
MEWLTKIKEVMMGPQVSEELLREKRSVPRVNCLIEATFELENSVAFEGSVTVLEVTGMRCILPRKLAPGQRLTVSVRSFTGVLVDRPYQIDKVNIEVVWCRKRKGLPQFNAGMRITDDQERVKDSWVHFVLERFGLASRAEMQKRRDVRVTSDLPVKCYFRRNSFSPGVAYDISLGGLKMNLKIDPGLGTEVELHIGAYRNLPVLKCHGKIVRSAYNIGRQEFVEGVEFKNLESKQMKLIGKYIMAFLQDASL